MPTIEISSKILNKLSRKAVTDEDLQFAKSSIDERSGDLLKIEISDTNRPDLWSVEGISRVIRGCFDSQVGKPQLNIKK